VSDWDALASELGIPPELRPREPLASAEASRVEPAIREEREELPAPSSQPAEPEIREPSVFGEEAGGFAESVDVMEDTTEFTERAAESPESTPETEEQRSSRRRRKRRRRGRGGARDEAAPGASEAGDSSELLLPEAPAESVPQQPFAEEVVPGDAVAEEISGGEATDEERSRRRRSRRRRKRRPEGDEPRAAAEAGPEATGEDRPRRERRPERSESAPRDDADDFTDEADDDQELRVGHRAIPTWDEAVGLIIAKNMEARAKRPNGGQARGNRDRRGGQRRPPRGK
jgi:hypothetical protein